MARADHWLEPPLQSAMRLITKLLVVGLALSLFLATVSWYHTHYRGEYYFPDRYEDAFGGMLISVALSALVVIATVVWHFTGWTKKRRDRQEPL